MNRSVAVSFALLLGSTVMAAQTGGQGYGFGVVQNVTPGPDGKMTWLLSIRPVDQAALQRCRDPALRCETERIKYQRLAPVQEVF